ncbi:bifunctional phosphoribosyl-AMP cyclohydrolase/phosphoribosyl-ATP diphosphatase HisIE [Luteibacter sp. UNCMF366Tsu5.1]|uniref:bifunctional phosphoribosyl-AMP cyclohydrolase/phosphoribosyl-ATP diphosphatase HisIE n=1 Tax=Luteibacter sp. UNCMF366Tsu5.1 TaxID=1502758 RepID=UPI00090887F8|nr:bifunctional phosphoribosyl-AMP cyclohydrolase/phosphoribosyl-ATP diphosphatase HisIE [Luteibacter sp. UNCMF366Tsu5.1]SFW63230.1 phosphoribosyl-ATP pyrophosphatase /phosphoribosyl-AMP cyclohydrolase [Luteibacter sp. UNCMF366Tsu5.1]
MSDGQADFAKGGGLLPAIVQHARTGEVLMLGYMDEAALAATREDGRVTFFSRSKGRLWTKGETSGNTLTTVDVRLDCDADTILVRALPAGPTCHNGTSSCFGDDVAPKLGFLAELDALVAERHAQRPQGSYTTTLFDGGMRRIAQKVGEEGVETALAVVAEDDDALVGEAADLVFHLMVALRARGIGFDAVAAKLASRHATARMTSS